MTAEITPFNPLDRQNLGASVAEALLNSAVHSFANLKPFYGAGVYAIYYSGDFPAYQAIAETNRKEGGPYIPIYVGKAVPSGKRKGAPLEASGRNSALFKRLREHIESIASTKNLRIQDFSCRYLVVEDIWIPLGETLLIAKFSPLWNNLLDGFGNHDPGSGRYRGLVPRWDVLHPGRPWASKCVPREETAEDIHRDVVQHLRASVLPLDPHILKQPQ